ncbi:hypothetical protein PCC8801_2665 [Rippkaea orientalis PCC 8801]|uniref:Uncharacterized protein n=1 Tax=Rippkaea orientalis (strain PCC 8801 / RF-1) TaxID=41431 RepID=B7K511_RIPO1|nr:hypothetical protein [Rippkaea orientalis]ACK66667.1 hypothetical protein PCC8801_2665 [Rippkaea orientalis PCC 8801]
MTLIFYWQIFQKKGFLPDVITELLINTMIVGFEQKSSVRIVSVIGKALGKAR